MDLTYDDLLPFAPDLTEDKANILIRGANARAAIIAPCITAVDFPNKEAVRDVILGAVLRRLDPAKGGIVTETVGPFSQTRDNSKAARVLFWPEEIAELQALCAASAVSGGPVFSFPDARPWPDC